MVEKWLPPIQLCCNDCNKIEIGVYSNLTLHFHTVCPKHGRKGIPSVFAKSSQFDYEIRISDELKKEYKKNQVLFDETI